MLKKLSIILLTIASLGIICLVIYKRYAATIIANELLKETEPAFLPKKVTEKIQKVKTQTNQLSIAFIKDIHKSGISLDQILNAVDQITEEEANLLLKELNDLGELKSPDQVFDLAKQHIPTDFDVEPLREPFRNKANIQLLHQLIQKANEYRDNGLIDFESAKAIAKRILIEKEKEIKKHLE